MVTPNQKRQAAAHLQKCLLVGQEKPLSQRRACQVLGLPRQSARRVPSKPAKDSPLQQQIQALAQKYPRYGYRRIHALLCREAEVEALNLKRVHRLWKEAARQVPPRKKHRYRHKNQEVTLPQQALYPGHVWSYDFVHDKCRSGAKLKLLCVNDEFTRQCHAIEVAAGLSAKDVQKVLTRLFAQHGTPAFLRSDFAQRQWP